MLHTGNGILRAAVPIRQRADNRRISLEHTFKFVDHALKLPIEIRISMAFDTTSSNGTPLRQSAALLAFSFTTHFAQIITRYIKVTDL